MMVDLMVTVAMIVVTLVIIVTRDLCTISSFIHLHVLRRLLVLLVSKGGRQIDAEDDKIDSKNKNNFNLKLNKLEEKKC